MRNDLIKNRILALDPTYKDFVLSDFASFQTQQLIQHYSFNKTDDAVIENGIMLYLLLFIDKYELMAHLLLECNIPIKEAINAVRSVINNLPPAMTASSDQVRIALTQSDSTIEKKYYVKALDACTDAQLYVYLLAIKNPPLTKEEGELFSEETVESFVKLLGDIILGFYEVADIEPLLIQELDIDAGVAGPLAADVREFLAPLDDPNWQPPAEDSELAPKVEDQPEIAVAVPTPTHTNSVPAPSQPHRPTVAPIPSNETPSEAEAELVKPMPNRPTEPTPDTPALRTMAHDMQDARSPQRHTFEPLPDDNSPTHSSQQT